MEDTRGRWTAKLIGELSTWFNRRHGQVNYYLTQMLTGHGLFCAYLHRMGKVGSPQCRYCGAPNNDALHTFFHCGRWVLERGRIEDALGQISPDNIVGVMLQCENKAIKRSKNSKWQDLREEVAKDPWGLGYRIVTRNLG